MNTDDHGKPSELDPEGADQTIPLDATPTDDTSIVESDAAALPDEPVPARSERPTAINARTEIPFGLILFLVIAVLLVVFTVQNSSEDVTLKFLVWEGSYPLALIIIGVVAVTVILDEVLGLFLRQRRRRRLAEKQELKRLREMKQ
jgi:uncharacterized integral membrane protein